MLLIDYSWNLKTKIIGFIISVFTIVLIDNIYLLLFIYISSILMNIFGKKDFSLLKKQYLGLSFFYAFMGLSIIFLGGEDTKTNILFVSGIILTGLSIVNLLCFIISYEREIDVLRVLEDFKIPSSIISILIITKRYIYVFIESTKFIKESLLLRFFKPSFRIFTFKVYGEIIGGIIIKSIDRGNNIYDAMVLRGFDGKVHISRNNNKIIKKDIVKLILFSSFFFMILIIEKCFFN